MKSASGFRSPASEQEITAADHGDPEPEAGSRKLSLKGIG